jgi:FkbM family methyltransferase
MELTAEEDLTAEDVDVGRIQQRSARLHRRLLDIALLFGSTSGSYFPAREEFKHSLVYPFRANSNTSASKFFRSSGALAFAGRFSWSWARISCMWLCSVAMAAERGPRQRAGCHFRGSEDVEIFYALLMQDLVPRAMVPLHRWLAKHPRTYQALVRIYNRLVGERRAGGAILTLAQPGDCVWDIGANVGMYTVKLLELVGPSGHVVAVDPVPEHVDRLRALGTPERLTVVAAALADTDGEMSFVVDGEESHIGEGPGAISVRVTRGDTLLDEGAPAPNVLKIDVEGFEADVLDGLPTALRTVRGLVIEVHFAALIKRGRSHDAARTVDLLRASGFEVRWLDSSHLLATSQTPAAASP